MAEGRLFKYIFLVPMSVYIYSFNGEVAVPYFGKTMNDMNIFSETRGGFMILDM